MNLIALFVACGTTVETSEPPVVTEVTEQTPKSTEASNNLALPPVVDPMNPAGTLSQGSIASAEHEGHSDLTNFNGTWIAIQAKDNRQVIHSICGTKAKTLFVGTQIAVETADERSEQTVKTVTTEESGLVTITLNDDSKLKLSQTSGILTATGWENDNMRYVKESTASALERIAIFNDKCPNPASTNSSAFQALIGEWIPGNEYKCAVAAYTLSANRIAKRGINLTIEDISNTDPLWLTVKSSDGVLSGIQVTAKDGILTLIDGSEDWQPQRLKKRNCDRAPTPTGPRKIVPPGLRDRVPKVRGR